MRTTRICLGLLLLVLLTACAQRAPLPTQQPQLTLPMQLHVQRRDPTEVRDWLLVIQQEGPALRWSLLDPLGIPLARQLLVDGRWHADGLLPPNAEARELFAALLFALTPAQQLNRLYPDATTDTNGEQRTLPGEGTPRWRVQYHPQSAFDLDVTPTLTYGVAPLAAPVGAHQP